MSASLHIFVAAGLLLGYQAKPSIPPNTAPHTQHKESYQYDVPGVTLHGRLIQRKVYGPPGYGETPATDAKASIFVLKLSHQISVEPAEHADANDGVDLDPAEGVLELQLFLRFPPRVDVRKLAGHDVTATGTLNESITASQYTKVWMDVTTLHMK